MAMILWDEPKRLANLEKHGLDFADLSIDFFLGALIIEAKQDRYMAVGRLDYGVIAVVFVTMGVEALSVVSMRAASRLERGLFNVSIENSQKS
jgi:uncharacterized DUF497 family protein